MVTAKIGRQAPTHAGGVARHAQTKEEAERGVYQLEYGVDDGQASHPEKPVAAHLRLPLRPRRTAYRPDH